MFTVSVDQMIRHMSVDGWSEPPRDLELVSYVIEQIVRAALNRQMCEVTPHTYRLIEVSPDHHVCGQLAATLALGIYRLCGGCREIMFSTPHGWRHDPTLSARYPYHPALSLSH